MATYCESFESAAAFLRRHGLSPTRQRIAIARILFSRPQHVSAEEVWCLANREDPTTSKATVYNTLNLFSERGLIREVIAHPGKVYYDSNTAPHHHFYDVDTGQLTDIACEQLELSRMPDLPPGLVADGVDIVVRVRSKPRSE
jgi:Fur family iron response transcriptional regulator